MALILVLNRTVIIHNNTISVWYVTYTTKQFAQLLNQSVIIHDKYHSVWCITWCVVTHKTDCCIINRDIIVHNTHNKYVIHLSRLSPSHTNTTHTNSPFLSQLELNYVKESMSELRMVLTMFEGPCSFNLKMDSTTLISVDVVSSPQNAVQSFATTPAPKTSDPRFTVPATSGIWSENKSETRERWWQGDSISKKSRTYFFRVFDIIMPVVAIGN